MLNMNMFRKSFFHVADPGSWAGGLEPARGPAQASKFQRTGGSPLGQVDKLGIPMTCWYPTNVTKGDVTF